MAVATPVLAGDVLAEHAIVKSGGQTIVGGVMSWTTIVLLQVDTFPQSSVAVQVRVILYDAGHIPGMTASENVMVTVGSHASIAVGDANTGTAGQLIGEAWFEHTITGGVISCTKIVWLQVDVFPQSSVADQVRLIMLPFTHDPGIITSENVKDTFGSQLSIAVAKPVLEGDVLAEHVKVALGGHVMTGPELSITEIICIQELVFPQSSIAVHVRSITLPFTHSPGIITSE